MKSFLTVKEGKTPYGQRWYIDEDCNTLGQFNLFVEHLNPITREIEFDRFSTAYTGTKRELFCFLKENYYEKIFQII